MLNTILFDLDGTLLDTAPDFVSVLNHLLIQHQKPVLALNHIRPYVSLGSRAMVMQAFNITAESELLPVLLDQFLELYEAHLHRETLLFNGMAEILNEIEQANLKWGIITNKRSRFTLPLLDHFGLTQRASVIVCSDHVKSPKPHPEPLLFACEKLNRKPSECLYIGDARADVLASQQAGMNCLLALYGYLEPNAEPHTWGAHGYLEAPGDLKKFL